MTVFSVETHDLHPDGKRKRVYIESEHVSLAALASDLRGGPIAVIQLFAKPEGDVMIVKDRRELLVTTAMVHSATTPDRRFVEFEDETPT